jgi:putative ABC transport system substrate-binding protein
MVKEMRRREFAILFAGATLAGLRSLRAQQNVPRIGVLLLGGPVESKRLSLSSELARLGYVHDRNIVVEVRAAEGDLSRLPALARELVATNPAVLVSASTAAALALAEVTRDIPIVVTVTVDPVRSRLSDSMARPSRNITGFTSSSPTLAAKRLQLLHQLVPDLRRVAYLSSPFGAAYELFDEHIDAAAKSLGVAAVNIPIPTTTAQGVSEAFAAVDAAAVQGIVVAVHPAIVQMSGLIITECLVRNLPSIHPWSFEAQIGALMSYGPATIENIAGAARYIDRILKGAKVSELPFEEPTVIKFTINLRTAGSMRVAIPPTLLAGADEVIE